MCKECGCDSTEEQKNENKQTKEIMIDRSVNIANDSIAHMISHNLKDKKILCINLMGSPGSGKTTVIEGISSYINPEEIAVIQGDLESDIDKIRLEKKNILTYQINTHSGCHLDAMMINKALLNMKIIGKRYLLIENVGNLVCPAGIKIGQHADIVTSSTTEGSDKPKKYPHIFLDAKAVVITKTDLSEAVSFDEKRYIKDITDINSKIKIMKSSSKQPESFKEIAEYMIHQRDHLIGLSHPHHDR